MAIKSRKHACSRQPGLACSTAFGLLFATGVHAADGDTPAPELPAVVVTGSSAYKVEKAGSAKLSQPLLDTTQTITAIPKEVLHDQGATTLAEALRNTPGLTLLLGENGNTSAGDNLFMRGFNVSNSIFVDNMRDMGAITHDVFNTEQIEVAKGPAGADNGRGTGSGYINMVSKAAQADDFSRASASYGSASRKRVTADLNRSLGEDRHTAVRLNVMGEEGGVAGRDSVNKRSWGIAPALAFGLNTNTRAHLYFQHIEQHNRPDGGIPTVGLPGYTHNALTGGAMAERVDTSNFYGHESDYEDVTADMFTTRFEHDLSKSVTLRNITRYGKTSMDRIMTGIPEATLTGAPEQWLLSNAPNVNNSDPSSSATRQSVLRSNELLTNQTSFSAAFKTGAIEHALVGGVEFIYEKQNNINRSGLGVLNDTKLYQPDVSFSIAPNPTPNGARSDGSTTTVAGYLFDTLKLGARTQLNAALRVERYNTTYNSVSISTGAGDSAPPAGTLVPTQVTASDLLFSWKLGALYKPAPNGSLYVAYATSMKPPGNDNFTLNSSASTTNETSNTNLPNVDPQRATNLEAGVKWDLFNKRLAVTGAVYRSVNRNDMAMTDPNDPAVVMQYGKRTVEGLELSAGGNITAKWMLSGGIALMDTEVNEGSRLVSPTSNQSGSDIQWSPKVAASLWSSYALPLGLTVGGGVRYTDSVARQTNNNVTSTTQLAEVESYWVMDAMAAYKLNRNLALQLNIYNLTNEEYVASLNNSGRRYVPGTPRSAMLTASFTY